MMKPTTALAHWQRDEPIYDAEGGLINVTYFVGQPPSAVLQWVNPIFDPRIHIDIDAVTRRLADMGLATPELLTNADGGLWVEDDEACWRLMTYIPGFTHHRVESTAAAEAAGDLVGRFHAAVDGWQYSFDAPRRNIHDTAARIAELRQALDGADDHHFAGPARELGQQVLDDWQAWPGSLDQPLRCCHGDLKISNLRFDDAGKGICLVDLDTLGPQSLDCEMGDAWRSWCNPAGEDDPKACLFQVDLFAASLAAWGRHLPDLDSAVRDSLVPGIERICLELAARFCADAVNNDYFREDRQKFPRLGEHNLHRARGQLRLARSAQEQRQACERIVAKVFHS